MEGWGGYSMWLQELMNTELIVIIVIIKVSDFVLRNSL